MPPLKATHAAIALLAIAAVALTTPACTTAHSPVMAARSPITAPPGIGTTLADRVYRAVDPRVGEPMGSIDYKITRPGDSLGTGLTGRLADAEAAGQAPGPVSVLHGTRGRLFVTSRTYADGSALTFVMSPAVARTADAGFDSPASDLDLDAVEIARAPDLGRDNTIADLVYRLAELQKVGSQASGRDTALRKKEYARVTAVLDSRRDWRVGLRVTAHQDGSARDFDFDFKDGSVLTLVTTQVSKQEHPVVAVEITRPSIVGQ